MRCTLAPLALLVLALATAPVTRAQTAGWRLHAVEHARSEGVPERRLLRGADPRARVAMSWYFFVARRGARVVLVDTGTDLFTEPRGRGHRRSWRVTRAVTVTEALARLALRPSDVTDVVLTHHHWDHVGAVGLFEDATVHAHPREWARLPARLRRPIERGGRLRASAADGELWPGLAVTTDGGHTARHRMVRVECADGPRVIASDAAYLFRNIEERRAVTVTVDPTRNVAAIARAAAEVGPARVLPGHDPALFERFRGPSDGVAAICP